MTTPTRPDATAFANLDRRFARALARSPNLIPDGSAVLVACSGGSDSTALLAFLHGVADPRRLRLIAAHFDHGVRADSREDVEFVRSLARRLGVGFRTERCQRRLTGQAQFREARFDFLERVAREVGADRIALGHQRDDQRETVVLNLMRGSGVRGARGMPVRRGRIVRPLLGFGRDELRASLEERGLSWVRDPANRDARFARSRVRAELIPSLGPEVGAALDRLASDAARAEAGLEARASRLANAAGLRMAPNGAQIARSEVLAYDRADRFRIVRKVARDLGFRLRGRTSRLADRFIRVGTSGHGLDVGEGLRIEREYDSIRWVVARPRPSDRELEIESRDPGHSELRLGGRDYEVTWGPEVGSGTWAVELPPSVLSFPITVRGPRPGDRIRTRTGSRKLKKWLNERRVPASDRGSVPVLVGADRRVLWVAGQSPLEVGATEEESFRIGIAER